MTDVSDKVKAAYTEAIEAHRPEFDRRSLLRGSEFDRGRFWRQETPILEAIVEAVRREDDTPPDFRKRARTK